MKHKDYFDTFLKDTVNLSQFNIDTLSGRVDSIYSALKADEDHGHRFKKKIPQGSWPQETIIKPQNGNAFDGDFMVQMTEDPDWAYDLKKYGDTIYKILDNKAPYKDMPHGRKCRCVYVNYANNAMHVDIVAFVLRADGTQWIINRDDGVWERTDTDGFTSWMKKQDKIAGGHLREVIRIMKYLRDHKNSFIGTKSILLTTLLGERVEDYHKIFDTGYYADLPTALVHIVCDLDEWLQARPYKPTMLDPSGSGTNFDHRWSQETYAYFRKRINVHAAEMKAAFEETDHDESLKKWQALFGDGFKAPKASTSASKFGSTGTGAAAGAATVTHLGRAG